MGNSTYSAGTVSVGSSSTSVTGSGTAWLTSGIRAGDVLVLAGLSVLIGSVESNTSITLARAWPGSAQTGADYDIMLLDDNVRSLVAANELLQQLQNGNITALAGLVSAANKLPYFTGAGAMAVADMTPTARAIMALAGSSGAKVPVVTETGAAALRSIVGTVSQSSGVPTGAVIERGSNANGEYVRFADGTQICWCHATSSDDVNVVSGSLYRSPGIALTFPASFATEDGLIVLPGNSDFSEAWITLGVASTTAIFARVLSSVNTITNPTYRAIAMGRWF